MALPAEKARYTFADYLTWDEKERIEIINGEAFKMATPSRIHQKIRGELFRQLANYLEGKNAKSTLPRLAFGCLRRAQTSRRTLTL